MHFTRFCNHYRHPVIYTVYIELQIDFEILVESECTS